METELDQKPETTESDSDVFDSAFLDITSPESKSDSDSGDDSDPKTETPAVEEEAPEEGDPKEEVPETAELDESQPEGVDKTQDEIKKLQDQLAALQAKLDSTVSTEEQKPVVKEEPRPIYSSDEEARIAQYREDWPEVVAGEALARRKEYVELTNYIFDEVAKRYEPLIEFYQNSSSRNQYSDIVALVPDYDNVRDKTLEWIDTQPTFLKKAYTEVTETGTPEEIAELINIFKKSTGYAEKTPGTVAKKTSMPAAIETTPNPAKTEAVAALKVVKSGRSSAADASPDAFDFDGSFEEAIKNRKR